jgi:arylsulfatase
MAAASVILRLNLSTTAHAEKPIPPLTSSHLSNIVMLCGKAIGISGVSVYTRGSMEFPTLNIDRIARNGIRFTDIYVEESCHISEA